MNFQLIVLQLITYIFIEKMVFKALVVNNANNIFKKQFILFLVYFFASWIISFDLNFCLLALLIAFFLKIFSYFANHTAYKNWFGKYNFFVSNIFEVLLIISLLIFYENNFEKNLILEIYWNVKSLIIVLSYLCCLQPANRFIKHVLIIFDIQSITNTTEELTNAGKLIGILERILVLTFMLLNQFEAIGFLLAAKSILRYNDSDIIKTEYVLIGTMSSYIIAIFFGIIISKI